MKFVLALSALGAAMAAPQSQTHASTSPQYDMKRLMSNAKVLKNTMLTAGPTNKHTNSNRRLDEDEYQVDISGYSVKFEQCQFVRAYDDELAEDEDASTVLTTKRFVKFRLCPSDDCATCDYNYGEYLVDLDTYLASTVQYFTNYQEEMCNACEENCQQDDDANNNNGDDEERRLQQYNVDCDSCVDECDKIENMEDNGYMEATDFVECQMVYDAQDDNRDALYAGPVCSNGGSTINIGVFLDEDCLIPDSSGKSVNDYLVNDDGGTLKLSHALLRKTYKDTCVSCKEPEEYDENADENEDEDNDNNNNDEQDQDAVIEMCEELYEAAAKCEKSHGFDNGYANYADDYENQLSQESAVCDFMTSVTSGTYSETGEIQVSGSNMVGRKDATTGGQKLALTFFILGTVAMAVYAAMLHTKLVKGGGGNGKADLNSAGGAMA